MMRMVLMALCMGAIIVGAASLEGCAARIVYNTCASGLCR